jgi:hypothetical protein
MSRSIKATIERVAIKYQIRKNAGPLTDVSKLRYQAVFMMGAGGSGKGYVGHKWMKYLPGGGMDGAGRKQFDELVERQITEEERSLSNLDFDKAKAAIERAGITVEVQGTTLRMPFRLFDNSGKFIDPSEYREKIPAEILGDVEGLKEVIYAAPKHEIPSYWRQVNPDLYKEELAGFMLSQPGYVHQMSSEMSRSYFETILESGDPLFVDGTGRNVGKMTAMIGDAKKAGYKVSLVLVIVPLAVNLIRNATRPRNVAADRIVAMWGQIRDNFPKLRSVADKSKVVINRNDTSDVKTYAANRDRVDGQIEQSYPGVGGLGGLLKKVAPNEYREWGQKFGWF